MIFYQSLWWNEFAKTSNRTHMLQPMLHLARPGGLALGEHT